MLAVSFVKQLQREIKRNPSKAAALAALCGVAVWFWLPLIWKPDDSVSTTIATPPANAPTTAVTTVASTVPAAAMEAPLPPWPEVVKRIEEDPVMQPIAVVVTVEAAEMRSPFAVYRNPEVVEAEEAKAAEVATVVEVVITPEEAGLAVSGTIIGRQRRTAMINGKIYAPGDTVEGQDGAVFSLASVDANGIVLQRLGRQYTLTVRRAPRAGRTEPQTDTP